MGADIVAFAQAETLCSATEAWSSAQWSGFALTARYFFLSCQEEVPKKKSRPLRRPATPGALRCSVATGHPRSTSSRGFAALGAGCGTRPFSRCALSVAKKYPWGTPCAARQRRGQDQHRPQFLAQEVKLKRRSPCGAPSNAGQPGEVGEHCLRAVGPSCAAAPRAMRRIARKYSRGARLNKSRREVGAADRRECSADRGAGGRLLFGDFFLATQEKATRRQGGTRPSRFLATLGMTAHPPSGRSPSPRPATA